ncbi:MAG: HAMP domain-containing histidine kinase [Desulfuromonadales bacterium]|nr:HAMP domain-containing histidine kinase [Desulfuromonadales bacterium]
MDCYNSSGQSDGDKCAEFQNRLKQLHTRIHRHHLEFHREFRHYHRYFRYVRPFVLIFNLVILYLLFRWVGIKAVGICFAVLIVIKEIFQFIFLLRLEKRIIVPIEELRQGVNEIAKGNYDVRVECGIPNDLGLLITSFNEMAAELLQGEKVQAEYEDNRKNLIANISHDLKTPITAIQGHIEALLDGPDVTAEKREKYLRVIQHNTAYLNRLIDDLFLFSKLDMDKLEFHYEPVRIGNYLADLMEEYQLELEGQGIWIQYSNLLEVEIFVNLDGKRFYQAINNIIRNAIGHGPDQGLSLQVKLYRQADAVAIDIRDNGPGIPPDKLPYIFNRFYRIDSERTKNLESTGLGLAITRELVQAHGGEISVSSREGDGTCFTVLLPEYTGSGEVE